MQREPICLDYRISQVSNLKDHMTLSNERRGFQAQKQVETIEL